MSFQLNPMILAGPGNAPQGRFYTDAGAMYTTNNGASLQDPANSKGWALVDGSGNPLYNGFIGQMAPNPSNPFWRERLMEWFMNQLRVHYAALFLDDVNPGLSQIVNAAGVPTAPVINGSAITPDQWVEMLADYCRFIYSILKMADPNLKVIHNTPWRQSPDATDPWKDPLVISTWQSADYICFENAFTDPNLPGGDGSVYWSLWNKLAAMDAIQAQETISGTPIGVHFLENTAHSAADQMFSVCCSLLATNGNSLWEDMVLPAPTYAYADVGEPLCDRQRSANGLLTRLFRKAFVAVVEPGAPAAVLSSGLTLQPRQGIVIPLL